MNQYELWIHGSVKNGLDAPATLTVEAEEIAVGPNDSMQLKVGGQIVEQFAFGMVMRWRLVR